MKEGVIVGSQPAASPVGLVLRAVLLEMLRRREFYVLLLLMGLFLIGALVVRFVGVENASTATFLMNLGLTVATFSAKLLTLLTAARQFPDELEQRTLYPLLAKPLTRGEYLVGKWAAAALTGSIVLLLLLLLAWAPVPQLESYSAGTFIQMLLLQVLSLGMISAFAILLSLFVPKLLTVVLLAVWITLGGNLLELIKSRFGNHTAGAAIRWMTGYLPDFSHIDLVLRYTDGLPPLSLPQFVARAVYAVVFTIFGLALANWLLVRRPL